MSEDQNQRDEQRRRLMARRAKRDIEQLLTNEDGLRRLRAISDEEWQEAVEANARNESP